MPDLHSVLVWQAAGCCSSTTVARADKLGPATWFEARGRLRSGSLLHDLAPISKSVVALLVGQAVGRGEIDVATPVLDFYPALTTCARDRPRDKIAISHSARHGQRPGLEQVNGTLRHHEQRRDAAVVGTKSRALHPRSPARRRARRRSGTTTAAICRPAGRDALAQRSGRSLLDLARSDVFEPLGIVHWECAHRPARPAAGLRRLCARRRRTCRASAS